MAEKKIYVATFVIEDNGLGGRIPPVEILDHMQFKSDLPSGITIQWVQIKQVKV